MVLKINKITKQFDYRQLRCPLSLVQAKLELKQGKKGDVFVFKIEDKTFYTDLKKLEQKQRFNSCLKEQNGDWLVEVRLEQDFPFESFRTLREPYD